MLLLEDFSNLYSHDYRYNAIQSNPKRCLSRTKLFQIYMDIEKNTNSQDILKEQEGKRILLQIFQNHSEYLTAILIA